MALENTCAESVVSTQATTQSTSRGRRGVGSRRHGRGGGHGGGRGRTTAPIHSCEDEDESGNFQF